MFEGTRAIDWVMLALKVWWCFSFYMKSVLGRYGIVESERGGYDERTLKG
jgi:hypothetical protein